MGRGRGFLYGARPENNPVTAPRNSARSAFLTVALVAGAVSYGSAWGATDAPVADGSNDPDLISEVRVEGNHRVEAEAVRRALKNKTGAKFDQAKTADDLRALWALNYFSDLQLLVQRLPGGGISYVVRVVEKPSVREVTLEGNDELSKDDFKESLDIKPFSILDQAHIRRNAKKIQDKYVEKGFFLAEVTYEIRPVEGGNEVDVVFLITERAKVQVKEVKFVGNEKVPADDLRAVMMTKEGGLLSFFTNEGTYREEMFQRDLQVIQGVYFDRGFINIKVDKPIVSLSPDKRYIFITLKVDEGEQFTIGKIDFSGDMLGTKDDLFAKMSSKAGDLFSRTTLARDIQGITDIYYDDGYAYANIVPMTAVNAEARTIDLTFEISKGNLVTVERIDVVGNTKTRDQVVRRQMRIYEGELFRGTGMRESKDRIQALGFFETVEVTQKPGSDNTKIVVQVEVKEKNTGSFQVGAGFSNTESFILTAQVSQPNFLGWGQTVAANLQLSGLRSYVELSYFDPYFLDTNFILNLSFYRTSLDYFGFIREATGGNAGIGYHFIDDLMVNVAYMREYIRVEPGRDFDAEIPLANQFRNGVTSALRLSAVWDRRNNRILPSSGHMESLTAEFAPGFLGGTFNFNRYTAFSRVYVPLPFGIVLKGNATIGVITELDNNARLPVSELYFLGGITSVRGYLLRSIAPQVSVLSSGSPDAAVRQFPVGGDKEFILNIELEFPIFEKLGIRGVVFYDAGNVFAKGRMFFEEPNYKLFLGLLHSVGFGVRWFSPIGPLRFEWGIPLTPRADRQDQPVLFEFTIGNSF